MEHQEKLIKAVNAELEEWLHPGRSRSCIA